MMPVQKNEIIRLETLGFNIIILKDLNHVVLYRVTCFKEYRSKVAGIQNHIKLRGHIDGE